MSAENNYRYYIQRHNEGAMLFENGLKVANVKGNILLYNINPLISYDINLFISGYVVEDPELAGFKYEFQRLYESIKLNKISKVKCIMELLEPFNILMRRKIEYALKREDLKCGGCNVENCKSVKMFGSVINVHHDEYGFVLNGIICHKIIEHICAPYPPRVKSARNFTLIN